MCLSVFPGGGVTWNIEFVNYCVNMRPSSSGFWLCDSSWLTRNNCLQFQSSVKCLKFWIYVLPECQSVLCKANTAPFFWFVFVQQVLSQMSSLPTSNWRTLLTEECVSKWKQQRLAGTAYGQTAASLMPEQVSTSLVSFYLLTVFLNPDLHMMLCTEWKMVKDKESFWINAYPV